MTENVEYHFSTGRYTRGGHFYYEDPGDGKSNLLFNYYSQYQENPVTYTKSKSRTGVAYELIGNNIGNLFSLSLHDKTCERRWGYGLGYTGWEWMKDVWIKFDVYGSEGGAIILYLYAMRVAKYVDGSPSYVVDHHEDVAFKFSNSQIDDAITINYDINGSGADDNSKITYASSLHGLHSVKIHLVSHETNGVFDVFLDNDTTPIHTYRGNVSYGHFFTSFSCNNYNSIPMYISNIVVSSTEPSLNYVVPYDEIEHPVVTYASINCEIKNSDYVWRYENAGTFDEDNMRTNGMDMIEVHDDRYSDTGVGLAYEYNWLADEYGYTYLNEIKIPENLQSTEFWIGFDVYGFWGDKSNGQTYTDPETGDTYTLYGEDYEDVPHIRCDCECGGDFGNAINLKFSDQQLQDDEDKWGVPGNEWIMIDNQSYNSDTYQSEGERITETKYVPLYGFHSIKIHVKSSETDGIYEVYIDDKDVPFYRYTGNVNYGHAFNRIFFDMLGVVLSNIKISQKDTDTAYVWRYTSPCITDDFGGQLVDVYDDNVSRTGVAVAISNSESSDGASYHLYDKAPIYGKVAGEAWAKFDACTIDEYAYLWFGFGNGDAYGAGCFTIDWHSGDSATCTLHCNGDDVTDERSISRGVIHTFRLHVKRTRNEALYEVYIDNDNVPTYQQHDSVNEYDTFYNFEFQMSGVAISNFIIGNVKMSANETLPYYVPPSFYYENPGNFDERCVCDGRDIIVTTDDSVSRTGTAIYNDWMKGQSYGNIQIGTSNVKGIELWARMDVYIPSDYDGSSVMFIFKYSDQETGVYLNRNDVDIYVANDEDDCDFDREEKKTCSLGTTPGLHTVKMHVITHQEHGLFEVFIDNDSTPFYTYTGNVANGHLFDYDGSCDVELYSTSAIMSNIVVSSSDIPMNYVVGQNDKVTHADIVREIADVSKFTWYYKNVGVIADFSEGAVLQEIHDNSSSHTGVGVTYDKNKTECSNSYITIPSEVSDELWVKFDVYCPTKDGLVYTEYGTGREGVLYHSEMPSFNCRYAYDNHYGTGMQVYCSNYQMLDDAKANEMFRVELADPDHIERMKRLPFFGFHTVRYHIVSGAVYGLFEVYVDDETTPYYKYVGKVCGGHKLGDDNGRIEFVLSDVVVSNIIISTNYIGMDEMTNATGLHADISREVIGQSDNPDNPNEPEEPIVIEGIATRQPIDLGSELTVGIGIILDGEGYAMIRTAGEDGHYTAWENYIPCERTCRYIDVRLHVRGTITMASLTIDRRTVSKTISMHLSAGENTVEYGEAFYNVPAVIPTAIGDGVTAHVISKGKESCVIKITDGNNNTVEGDVDILIRGW